MTGLKRQEDLGGGRGGSFNSPGRQSSGEGQKAGWRLGTGAPKDLGAGLTSTPVPELPLGWVLNATPVFNENSYHL